jgi:hypothetical protein
MCKFILTIILSSTLLISCQDQASLKWEETMKVHDVVMLKMQKTGESGMKVNDLVSRAKLADSNSILFSKIDTLEKAYHQLELADEEMMDWMASIQKPQKGDPQKVTFQYLEKEQQAIIAVGHKMDAAIDHAEMVIKSLEKK